MQPKRLVLMVEGAADQSAVPVLAQKIITQLRGWDSLFIKESDVFRVGNLSKIVSKQNEDCFLRFLKSAEKKPNLGAVLLLLDGDANSEQRFHTSKGVMSFCAKEMGTFLALRAKEETGAGTVFSFTSIFAMQEFESWILAGNPKFAELLRRENERRHDNQKINTEIAPRDVKGKIKELTGEIYREKLDQERFTSGIDIDLMLRSEPCIRSFRRLYHAFEQILEAIRSGKHVATP